MLIAVLSAVVLAQGSAAAAPPTAPVPNAGAPVIDKTKTEIRLPAAAVAGVVPQGAHDEIVCRKEQLLGSRVFKTVCEQKSVADERRILDRDALRHIQQMSMSGGH